MVGYRQLNRNKIPDRYLLPFISDQISRLSSATYYNCLDCASGYHKIPILEPDSSEHRAFFTNDGLYEYLAMPLSLRNGLSVFQKAVST